MTACVFVGPTLAMDDVATHLDAVCLPPVAQGDVLRAVRRFRPQAIGIIDGLFGGAPAVWHKEILWALSKGVAVFGSASMGALRAAELHRFGMRGVGRIFEAYRDGDIEDDDEVAVIHGPAGLGYPVLSEPMVNIRATLARAEREAVLHPGGRAGLERAAKALFFADRSWPNILGSPEGRAVEAGDRNAFEAWFATGRVDLKRDDALAMLAAMRVSDAKERPPSPVFHFERTHYWTGLVARERQDSAALDETIEQWVLDEWLLKPDAHHPFVRARAMLRYAGDILFDRDEARGQADADDARAISALRSNLGLFTRADVETWAARNDLDLGSLAALAAGSARLEAFVARAAPSLSGYLLDELRSAGMYEALADRARLKQERLSAAGKAEPCDDAPADRLARRQWFVETRLQASVETSVDDLLKVSGFADLAQLDRALQREHLYLKLGLPGIDD